MENGPVIGAIVVLLLVVALSFAYAKCAFGGPHCGHGRSGFLGCGGPPIPGARAEADALRSLGWTPRRGEGFAGSGQVCGGGVPAPQAASQALAMRQLAGGRYVEGQLPGVFGASSMMSTGLAPDAAGEALGLAQAQALPAEITGPTGVDLYALPDFGLNGAQVEGDHDGRGDHVDPDAAASHAEGDGFAHRAVSRQQGAFAQLKNRRRAMASATGGPAENHARFASMREGFGGPRGEGRGWVASDNSPTIDLPQDGEAGYGWPPSDNQGSGLLAATY